MRALQMVAHARLRVEYHHGLLEPPSCSLYRTDLIGIARNDNKAFDIGLRGINHHFDGKVDV